MRRAAAPAVPLAWVGGALAFHQHHPPTRLRAGRASRRWSRTPAATASAGASGRRRGWLEELAAAGLVGWDEEAGTLEPCASAIR